MRNRLSEQNVRILKILYAYSLNPKVKKEAISWKFES